MIQKLDLKQIEQGTKQCLLSAQEILHSANTLKGAASKRVSLSLYLLASEELGKAVLLYRTILFEKDDEKARKDFWYNFNNHKSKLLAGSVSWTRDMFNLDSNAIADWLKSNPWYAIELNLIKLAGFYIDFNKENKKFEKSKLHYLSWDLWSNVANHQVKELNALQKIGLFRVEKLERLQSAFTSLQGRAILQMYNEIKGSIPIKQPFFTKEYQQLLEEYNLNELLMSYRRALFRSAKSLNFYRNISYIRRPFVYLMTQLKVHQLKQKKNSLVSKKKVLKVEKESITIRALCTGAILFLIPLVGFSYVFFYTKAWLFFKLISVLCIIFCLWILYKSISLIILKVRFPWIQK